MSIEDIKHRVAVANRILAELGLASGIHNSVGHASMRVPDSPDHFVVKGRGYEMDVLERMRPEDMVTCDLEGFKVDGPKGVSQCYEVKMHSCIYRAHPEVQSVVHVHPRHSILMSILNKTVRPMSNSGGQLVRKPVPIYPHSHLVLTDEHGSEVAELLGEGNAVLLRGHGAVTTGGSLQESVTNMAHLEEQAILNTWAYAIAGEEHPFMTDEILNERNAIRDSARHELPHFRDSYDPTAPRVNGFWAFYSEKVSKDL